VSQATPSDSARKRQILEAAYTYVSEHGLADMSLRPLAEAIGSSPRVLLYLLGSKDALVVALLARARADELRLLGSLGDNPPGALAEVGEAVWHWLSAPEHRGLLILWAESYARSLVNPDGPWADFAAAPCRTGSACRPRPSPVTSGGAVEATRSGPCCWPCCAGHYWTCSQRQTRYARPQP
jgi:AcrR family transcriptional regulator